jgi:hypothetical protein
MYTLSQPILEMQYALLSLPGRPSPDTSLQEGCHVPQSPCGATISSRRLSHMSPHLYLNLPLLLLLDSARKATKTRKVSPEEHTCKECHLDGLPCTPGSRKPAFMTFQSTSRPQEETLKSKICLITTRKNVMICLGLGPGVGVSNQHPVSSAATPQLKP